MLSENNLANCFVCEHRNEIAAHKDLVVLLALRNNVDDQLKKLLMQMLKSLTIVQI